MPLTSLLAQKIINPAISGEYGGEGDDYSAGSALALFIGRLWMLSLSLGGIALIIYLILGAFKWLTSGGDKAQLQAAQQHMTQAIIGMVILAAIYAIVTFISPLFFGEDHSILNIDWSLFAPAGST